MSGGGRATHSASSNKHPQCNASCPGNFYIGKKKEKMSKVKEGREGRSEGRSMPDVDMDGNDNRGDIRQHQLQQLGLIITYRLHRANW
jgi:hypothetical protein